MTDFFATYSKDDLSRYVAFNDDVLKAASLEKTSDLIGRNDHDLTWAHLAPEILEHDALVKKTETTHMFFEKCMFDGKFQVYRAYKSPLFGVHRKIIGIQCISVFVSEKSLIPLSRQQTACLKYLGLGYTHKMIAQNMGLASKTVEHYLDTVKTKLNCETRHELILQAIERGLVSAF